MEKLQELDEFAISELTLSSRIGLIKRELVKFYSAAEDLLAKFIDSEEGISEEDYNSISKAAFITSLIITASDKDEDNSGFNRLLYYMYTHVKTVAKLVEQFDLINVVTEDGKIKSAELVIKEESNA